MPKTRRRLLKAFKTRRSASPTRPSSPDRRKKDTTNQDRALPGRQARCCQRLLPQGRHLRSTALPITTQKMKSRRKTVVGAGRLRSRPDSLAVADSCIQPASDMPHPEMSLSADRLRRPSLGEPSRHSNARRQLGNRVACSDAKGTQMLTSTFSTLSLRRLAIEAPKGLMAQRWPAQWMLKGLCGIGGESPFFCSSFGSY